MELWIRTCTTDLNALAKCGRTGLKDILPCYPKTVVALFFLNAFCLYRLMQFCLTIWALIGRRVETNVMEAIYCPIKRLPLEILLEVFTYLDVHSIQQASQVGRLWFHVGSNPTIWKHVRVEAMLKFTTMTELWQTWLCDYAIQTIDIMAPTRWYQVLGMERFDNYGPSRSIFQGLGN